MMLRRSISGKDSLTGLFSTLSFIDTRDLSPWWYSGVNQAQEQQAPAVLVKNFSNTDLRIHRVAKTGLCDPSLPIEPLAKSQQKGVDIRARKIPLCIVGIKPGVFQLSAHNLNHGSWCLDYIYIHSNSVHIWACANVRKHALVYSHFG